MQLMHVGYVKEVQAAMFFFLFVHLPCLTYFLCLELWQMHDTIHRLLIACATGACGRVSVYACATVFAGVDRHLQDPRWLMEESHPSALSTWSPPLSLAVQLLLGVPCQHKLVLVGYVSSSSASPLIHLSHRASAFSLLQWIALALWPSR